MKKKIFFIAMWLLFVAGLYYVMLPPVNVHSQFFWTFVLFVMIIPAILLNIGYRLTNIKQLVQIKRGSQYAPKAKSLTGVLCLLGAAVIGILIIGSFSGATFFHASAYASILKIEEKDFST